jgi:hypothetical protein
MANGGREASHSTASAGRFSGGWVAILVFAAAVIGAAVALAVFHATGIASKPPSDASAPAPERTSAPAVPHLQQGSVRPAGQVSGTVYYPLPYASPPHLTLSAPDGRYVIGKQDEISFTWTVADRIQEAKKAIAAPDQAGAAKTAPADQEFAWESKGVLAAAGVTYPRLFEQTGSFETRPGAEGDVYYPFPYASPPNVELTGLAPVRIVDIMPLGFRWSSAAKKDKRLANADVVRWTSRGVRATAEEYQRTNALGPSANGPALLEQIGWFTAASGEAGEVHFPRQFALPPNVELWDLSADRPNYDFLVVECKPGGFKWKAISDMKDGRGVRMEWVAKGVGATQGRK